MATTRHILPEEAAMLVQEAPEPLEICKRELLDPSTERAQHLRPTWTSAGSLGEGTAARAERRSGSGDGAELSPSE